MAERYDVSGKVVLVTGAARGIGAETARQLSRKGARLALVGLEPELLEALADELGGAERATAFEADVTDLEALRRAAEGTVERFGGIDVVIANAGIGASTPIGAADPEAFDQVVAVNLGGVFRTLHATVGHVVQRRGYLLPVASLAAAVHAPMMGAYAATKAGVEALGDCLRGEVAHTGTRVGVAYFGFIDTDMVRRGFDSPSGRRAADLMGVTGPNHAIPVSRAGRVIVEGIERRARQVYAPRWAGSVLRWRTFVQPLQERRLARDERVPSMLAEAAAEPARVTTEQPRAHQPL